MVLLFDIGNAVDRLMARFELCPWSAHAGGYKYERRAKTTRRNPAEGTPLYTEDERRRRDETPLTLIQGILAPLQFVVFLVSLALVLHYMVSGVGFEAATTSIVIKTLVLYTIMVTGAMWERVVFGRYLFAPAFFWEDVVSMLVIALHTAYLFALFTGMLTPYDQMLLALAAYAAYVVNAVQFLLKFRAARLTRPATASIAAAE